MRIPTLATSVGMFNLLGLDEVVARIPVEAASVQTWLKSAVATLSPHVSGLVLEPTYGLNVIPAKAKKVGVALRLESVAAEQDPLSLPPMMSDWGVEEISQNYSVAKVTLYYHPEEEKALDKKKWVAEIADYCHHQSIDMMLCLHLFQPPTVSVAPTSDHLIEAIQELRGHVDLLAIDPPTDSLAAATVTAELDVPWVVMLGEGEYNVAKEALRSCLESGAKGWLAGAGLWTGLPSFITKDHQIDWKVAEGQLAQQIRDRVIELARITNEVANQASERRSDDETA